MASGTGDYAQLTYDKVADDYDLLWCRHVAGPNARLTVEMDFRPGERVADLACGTGLYTVEMARLVAPGPVVGVDYSEGMLAAARQRAEDEGLELELVNARAEDFIAGSPAKSLDVVSVRFVLAYLDWAEVLPQIGRVLRPGGRVGRPHQPQREHSAVRGAAPPLPQVARARLEALPAHAPLARGDLEDLPAPARDVRRVSSSW